MRKQLLFSICLLLTACAGGGGAKDKPLNSDWSTVDGSLKITSTGSAVVSFSSIEPRCTGGVSLSGGEQGVYSVHAPNQVGGLPSTLCSGVSESGTYVHSGATLTLCSENGSCKTLY